jgi:hypothetical protein
MSDITKKRRHLIVAWADQAAADLDKALNVTSHTGDTRLIARVRSLRDRALDLHNDHHDQQGEDDRRHH